MRKKHSMLGAKKLAKLLSEGKAAINHKRVARILKENDLTIKIKRKRIRNLEAVTRLPIPQKVKQVNQIWSIDFMCSRKNNRFRFMLFNVVDLSSRRAPIMSVERSYTSADVTCELAKAMQEYGKPKGIITDNGVEFTASHFKVWCKRNKITHYLTRKGSPQENAYVESFNSCVRREVLDGSDFMSMKEMRVKIESWRVFYNTKRPHGALGYYSPEKYLKLRQT